MATSVTRLVAKSPPALVASGGGDKECAYIESGQSTLWLEYGLDVITPENPVISMYNSRPPLSAHTRQRLRNARKLGAIPSCDRLDLSAGIG